MKKSFSLLMFLGLAIQFSFAQKLSKEETKQLKAELKNYEKDLVGYKAKMQDIRNTMDSNDAEIKRLKDDIAYSSTKQAELENKVADYNGEITRLQSENNVLKGYAPDGSDSDEVNLKKAQAAELAEEEAAAAAAPAKGRSLKSSGAKKSVAKAPVAGTVYKVQIGLYKDFDITRYFEEPRSIGYETVEGMNRYVISDFTNEDVAQNFATEMARMGVKGAFVAKYENGKRVAYEYGR